MARTSRYSVDLASIRRRLPRGFTLPPTFLELARWCQRQPRGSLGWFRLASTNPDPLAGGKVAADLVPFMILPDGSLVGFWFAGGGKAPPIVCLGSEGQQVVVAASWPTFLRKLVERTTRLDDLDDHEGEAAPPPPHWRKAPPDKNLAPLRTAFRRWLRDKQPKADRVPKDAAETVRAELVRMSRKYWAGEPAHLRWVDYFVTLSPSRYEVHWYDGGLKPFPDAKRMKPVFTAVRDLYGKSLVRTPVKVWGAGDVFVAKNNHLAPPKR